MATNTRKYSDFDATFAANPNTGDLMLRQDESAVKFAIKNLVLTRNYERPFDSSIGSQIKRYLFEPMDDMTIIIMKKVISDCIVKHEPRVDLLGVNVNANPDGNEITFSITFAIKNTEKPLNLTFVLDRTR